MAQGDHSSIGLLGSLRRLTRNVQVVLSLLAVGIGLTAALAGALPAWRLLLVPPLGGVVVGLFVHFFLPGTSPGPGPRCWRRRTTWTPRCAPTAPAERSTCRWSTIARTCA